MTSGSIGETTGIGKDVLTFAMTTEAFGGKFLFDSGR